MNRLPRPTGRGWCLVIAGVALVITGAAAGFADLIRAGIFALTLVVTAALVTLVRPRTLRVDRWTGTLRMQADRSYPVQLRVTAPGGTWTTAGLVEHQSFRDHRDPRWTFDRLPRGTTTLAYEVRPPHRGEYTAGPLTLALGDPLGLVHTDSRHGQVSSWLVWPHVVDLTGPGARRRGEGDDEIVSAHASHSGHAGASIREYAQGDDMRMVHWPATAHRGELMVRQFDPPAQPMTRIVLHGSVPEIGTDDAWETLVSMTASACSHLGEHGIPVSVGVGTRHVETVTEALDELATVTDSTPPDHDLPPAPTLLFQHTSVSVMLPPPRHLAARAVVAGPGADEAAHRLESVGWIVTTVTSTDDPAVVLSRELEAFGGLS